MIPGLRARTTSGGVPVLRLHYSADPAKRPGTPVGDRWLQESLGGYAGGLQSPRWRKEMEIDYSALSGEKVFPFWEQWTQAGRVVIPPFDPRGYKLFGTYDHGWRHKACYLVHGINGDGRRATLWEFWADHVPLPLIARIIRGETVFLPAGHGYGPRRFGGNPFAGRETWRKADPSIFAEDQPMSDNTMKSIADLFLREQVHFGEGKRGGDTTVVEWLLGYDWLNPEDPTHCITANCVGLIHELGILRFKELSAMASQDRAQPEQIVDKQNDAWDALKMFIHEFPPGPATQKPAQKPGTFEWWRKQTKAAGEGRLMATYRREMVG